VDLSRRYQIPLKNVVGHSDIAGQRAVALKLRADADVKEDPGPKFDWSAVKKKLSEDLTKPPKTMLKQSSSVPATHEIRDF